MMVGPLGHLVQATPLHKEAARTRWPVAPHPQAGASRCCLSSAGGGEGRLWVGRGDGREGCTSGLPRPSGCWWGLADEVLDSCMNGVASGGQARASACAACPDQAVNGMALNERAGGSSIAHKLRACT